MEPSNRFQGIYSASLCSLSGRYDNPIPTRFLAPIDCLKIPALFTLGLTDDLTPSRNAKPNLQSPEKEHKIIIILPEIKAGRRKGGGVDLVLFFSLYTAVDYQSYINKKGKGGSSEY
jgi:hypothetical protein